jgi:hypothetical protein
MTPVPRPPFLADDPDGLVKHVAKHGTNWFNYYKLVDKYIMTTKPTITKLKEQSRQSRLQNKTLQKEISYLHQELVVQDGVIKYQKDQLREKKQEYLKIIIEQKQAILAATPAVNMPVWTPEPAAEMPAVTLMGAPALIDPPSAASAGLSERLPDPDRFEGDRKNLHQFVSQIKGKMNINLDYFLTPHVTDPIANRSRKYMIYPATRTGDPVLRAAYSAADTCSPDRMSPSFLFNPYCPEAESLGITGPMILEERK